MSKVDLHIEIDGNGPPVVLIHGWGMHAGLFKPMIEELNNRFTFYSLDLPGHGNSNTNLNLSDLDSVTHQIVKILQQQVSAEINLLGWSLGGLIAQRMASLYPTWVAKLILVSSSACFEKKPDWLHGIESDILDHFSSELKADSKTTLDRFLALQFMGTSQQKENVKRARDLLAMKAVPSVTALQQGLTLLKNTDLRNNLADIKCPCLLLSGERDSLVPSKAIRFMSEHLPQAHCYLIKSGSHAPFLSHAAAFNSNVEQFLL